MNQVLIDGHFHLLQSDIDYPWMNDQTIPLMRYTQTELEEEFANNRVIGGVLVQAVGNVRETQSLLRIARKLPLVLGVVGWIDLTSPTVDIELARLLEEPGGEKLVGVRHQTHDELDPFWLQRADVLRGLECVAEWGLTFDLLIRPREIPAARSLASSLPHLELIVDHLAKPVPNDPQLDRWSDALASLAAYQNTHCKLSGLVSEVVPLGSWTPEQLQPYLAEALRTFGPRRTLFGSDWPVCRLAATYAQVVELATGSVDSLAPLERSAVLGGNAVKIYNLGFD